MNKRVYKTVYDTNLELMRTSTNMNKHGPESCQERIDTVENLSLSYRSNPVTDFIFGIACNLVEFFDAVLGRTPRAIAPVGGLLGYSKLG